MSDLPLPASAADQNLQGVSIDASDPVALRKAIDLALHYRGDVTIERKRSPSGAAAPAPLEGYVFDCKPTLPAPRGPGEVVVRIIPAGRDERIAIPFSDITRLTFTGKDTASGKSFETWVRKYLQKKQAGETASIEAETLD